MSFTYFINDISLTDFKHSGFTPDNPSGDEHLIPFEIKKLSDGQYSFDFKHEYSVFQNSKVVIKISTRTFFTIKEDDHTKTTISVDTCLKVIRIGLEYTRALLAIESKRQLKVFVLMNQPDDNILRQHIQQEIIKLN